MKGIAQIYANALQSVLQSDISKISNYADTNECSKPEAGKRLAELFTAGKEGGLHPERVRRALEAINRRKTA